MFVPVRQRTKAEGNCFNKRQIVMFNNNFSEVLKTLEKAGVKIEFNPSLSFGNGFGTKFDLKGEYSYNAGADVDYIRSNFSASGKVPFDTTSRLKKEVAKLDLTTPFYHLNSYGMTAYLKKILVFTSSFSPELSFSELKISVAQERIVEKIKGTFSIKENNFVTEFDVDVNLSIQEYFNLFSKMDAILGL